jgi:acetolactate synthase-1/2/3 large subunit
VNGAEVLATELHRAGVEHVFGIPGTSLVDLFEAFRGRRSIRVIRPTNELMASFMANGYARASGRTAVVCTIAGPGITYALTGIAEALLDSVPVVYVVDAGARQRDDGSPASQAIAQTSVLTPVVKAVLEARSAADVAEVTRTAVALVGLGAADASPVVTRLAERLQAPVVSTTSGRGVVSEEHPLCLPFDAPGASVETLNEVVGKADLVLALGCKLGHNGSRGYELKLPRSALVRVDSSPDAFGGAYPASETIVSDVDGFVRDVLPLLAEPSEPSRWTADEFARIRSRLADGIPERLNPRVGPVTARQLFATLRRHLPATAVVATDSGFHQYLVRAHFTVVAPRTLLVPTDFQSMGFGIPAAIGASVATGARAVVVTGDGGFASVGLELMTAVEERIPLTVLVLVDGYLGLIRLSQLARTGREADVAVSLPRLEAFASAVGADHMHLDATQDADLVLEAALRSERVTIVESPVADPPGTRKLTARGRVAAAVRGARGRLP